MTQFPDAALGTIQPDDEHYAVQVEHFYPVPTETVWAALTDPGQLRGWIGELTGTIAAQSRFSLRLVDDPPETVQCQVQVFQPPRVLEFSWTPANEKSSALRFELRPVPGGTRFLLSHRVPSATTAAEYGAGWHTYLEQLAAYLADEDGRGSRWDVRYQELLPTYRAQA